VRFQEACFLYQPQTPEQKAQHRQNVCTLKDLHIYVRYQAAQDRAYQRAASELAKRRKDRALLERGFESQKRAAAEEERRETRQKQRDELHPWRVMTAQLKVEQLAQRVMSAGAGFQPPQIGSIAA
jgi:anti-sigma factor RsiW